MYQAIKRHVLNGQEEAIMLKCLVMIIKCDKLSNDSELVTKLISILLDESKESETLSCAIMTLTSCMLSWKLFENPEIPWQDLTKLLVNCSYTKCDVFLQISSIQALRVMSDKASVKDELRKVYKSKIHRIPCISEDSKDLKKELIDWIDYRSYKSNDASKYSKLFI